MPCVPTRHRWTSAPYRCLPSAGPPPLGSGEPFGSLGRTGRSAISHRRLPPRRLGPARRRRCRRRARGLRRAGGGGDQSGLVGRAPWWPAVAGVRLAGGRARSSVPSPGWFAAGHRNGGTRRTIDARSRRRDVLSESVSVALTARLLSCRRGQEMSCLRVGSDALRRQGRDCPCEGSDDLRLDTFLKSTVAAGWPPRLWFLIQALSGRRRR